MPTTETRPAHRSDASPVKAAQAAHPTQQASPAQPSAAAGRLLALDAFRGLTVLLMLLVNNVALGEFTPRQLQHAPWGGGVRLADLVFPWFLFCVGVAVPFAFASARKRGVTGWRWAGRAAARTVALVLLGLLLTSSIASAPLLGLGVLQLIGLAFLVAALLYPLAPSRRLLVAALLLVAYWAAIRFYPVPGVGTGVFEEDRNLVLELNRRYLEAVKLRGLASVVPTGALALIATVVGDLLRGSWAPPRKVLWLLVGGASLTGLGALWSLDLDFNKTFWTPSYILLGAGSATAIVGLFTLLIDATGWRAWAFPLVVPGSNALLAYVAPILVKVWVLQDWQTALDGQKVSVQRWLLGSLVRLEGQVAGGWLYTAGYILVWWLVLLWLYRKKVFLRV